MSRECTVCKHPKRSKIDKMLADGIPYGTIAKQFDLSKQALQRHKTKHLLPQQVPPEIVAVTVLDPATETIRAKPGIRGFDLDGLYHKMEVMVEKNFEIIEKFELLDEEGNFVGTAADIKAKAAAITAMKSTLEFIAKMFGLLNQEGTSPGYLELKDRYEKQKQFILEHLCDHCRTEFLKYLEE